MSTNKRPPIPFADYQRIFQVLYTLLETADGYTYKGCKFYAVAGAFLLHHHYKLDAQPMMGAAAFKLNANEALFYGRVEDNKVMSDENAFHAWIECDGYMIDFMAPMFREALQSTGSTAKVDRRMFQKSLGLDAPAFDQIPEPGNFCRSVNFELTSQMRHDFTEDNLESDLVKIASDFYRRPPKTLDRNYEIYDTKVKGPVSIKLSAPTVTGIW